MPCLGHLCSSGFRLIMKLALQLDFSATTIYFCTLGIIFEWKSRAVEVSRIGYRWPNWGSHTVALLALLKCLHMSAVLILFFWLMNALSSHWGLGMARFKLRAGLCGGRMFVEQKTNECKTYLSQISIRYFVL